MRSLPFKLLLNAILFTVVGLVAIAAYNWLGVGREETQRLHAVREAVQRVDYHVFVVHYNAVDIEYTQAPVEWLSTILHQRFVVLLRGSVPAGFDLTTWKREPDIWVGPGGQQVQLTLPPPVVFEAQVAIDERNSRLIDLDNSCLFWCAEPLDKYLRGVATEGKRQLIDMAIQNGILNQAAREGRAHYESLLRSLGFQQVRVVVTGYGL